MNASMVAGASVPLDVVEAETAAELLATLGDPVRLRILTVLETVCVPVGAIVTSTGPRQPTVSHHLRVLRDRRLVGAERRGSFVYYSLTVDGLAEALGVLRRVMADRDQL